MSLGSSSSAIKIQTTSNGTTTTPMRTIQKVTIHPVALFSILDHFLRRKDTQDRVIGCLLGTRSETEIEVHSCFAALHGELSNSGEFWLEDPYINSMYELHRKVHPKEVIVGWYSTGSTLDSYSALVQDYFEKSKTAPHPSVHVALNTGTEGGENPGVAAYLSSPVGVSRKEPNCIFVPVPCEFKYNDAERSGVDLLVNSLSSGTSLTNSASNLEVLQSSIQTVMDMLDRVLTYVRSVIAGETKGDPSIGRYLLDTFSISTEGLDQGSFASSLQDTLMVSYLANLVRAQAEVSSRLHLVSA